MSKQTHHNGLSHHFNFYRFLHNQFNDLLIAETFRHIALSLISLFLPLYLIELGYRIIDIVFLELLLCFVIILIHYILLSTIHLIYVKRLLIISYILNTILYLVLYYAEVIKTSIGDMPFLIFICFLNIVPYTMYWTAHHIYLIKSTNKDNRGKRVGLVFAVPALIGMFGPYLGAVVIDSYSFHYAFFLSSLFLILASGVLFFSSNIKVNKPRLELSKIIDRSNKSKNLIYFVLGLNFITTGFLWPIFLFYSAIKIVSIGIIYLISNAAYSVIGYLSGKHSDKKGNCTSIQAGTIGHGLSLVFRGLSSGIASITIFQTMGGVFGALLQVPLESGYYRFAHKDYYNGTMNREVYMYLGRIFMLIFFLLIAYFVNLKTAFMACLVTAGFATCLLNFVIKDDCTIIYKN